MKKLILLLAALITMSCSNDIVEEDSYTVSFDYTQEEYNVMYEFIETLHKSDLFNVASPTTMNYNSRMLTAAPIIMSDTFIDTIGEGDCEKVYFLMYDYFKIVYPESSVVIYLKDIIDRELY